MSTVLDELESTYVVLRSFTAEGRTLDRGEVVDTSEWRHTQPLVRDRRIAHIYTPEARVALPEGHPVPTLNFETPDSPKRRGRPPKIREDSDVDQ